MQRRAANQSAKHISAEFIRWNDAVGDEERRGARVLGDDTDRNIGVAVAAVRLPRKGFDLLHEGLEEVRPVHVARHALKHLCDPLEPRAGVDVLLRQRHERPVCLAIVLLEDEVPDLDIAAAVLAGVAVVGR